MPPIKAAGGALPTLRSHALQQDGPVPDGCVDSVPPLIDVVVEGVQARCRQHIGGVWVYTLLHSPLFDLVRYFTCDAPRRLYVESIKGMPGGVGEAPRLAVIEEDAATMTW